MKDFNYNQLISFVEVALYLNISTASKHLNKSRATISEHIELLELELGHKLFDRDGRQLKLTSFGEKILRPSILLTRQIYTWQNTVDKARPTATNVQLRIAYDPVIPQCSIRSLLEYFNAENMNIECIAMGSNISAELLDKNIVDLIITPEHGEDLRRDYEWKIIGSMPYRFYAHHNLFGSETIELSQLLNQTQILPSAYLNKSADEKFIFTPNNKIINDITLLQEALENKVGWAFLPVHLHAERWRDVVELPCSLGGEGFVTPVLARWRPGEEVIVSPVLNFFESTGPVRPA
ncbi:LysR family transcriptional regulator [Vibrio sp. SCSIO 43137]|uniref:LysR family transcriptional regulator n=1 Tax=Vibrio sp. SCSIO 43137 TaxID=3021011 RepID=UPI002307B055|nr:LysR family transcriptional regulator [Vibrio sp. SCSIO 43137]WCE31464.1 LysR family transcriptional regulator [Vibrio sp. SCSIO 43137]